jgi:hypothetical protein
MYLKIEGHLLDVLGEKARGDMEAEFGIRVSPTYQFVDRELPVTLAIVVNDIKAAELLHDIRVTKLDTVADFNAAIDALYEEKYTLTDSTALLLSLQLSGKTAADVPGYDAGKGMQEQANLKALYEANMSGITLRPKPPHLKE